MSPLLGPAQRASGPDSVVLVRTALEKSSAGFVSWIPVLILDIWTWIYKMQGSQFAIKLFVFTQRSLQALCQNPTPTLEPGSPIVGRGSAGGW